MKPKLLANALCPFSQSMAHKILSRDKVETNKNVKKEREIDGERERESEMEKGGGSGRERETGTETEGGRQGNVHKLCSFCHNVFRKGGGEFR